MAANPNPRVGVAAVIYNQDGHFVAGKRLGSHGAGLWQLPGGHLEFGESFIACAERESLEETGLRVRGVEVVAVTNDVFGLVGGHYITLFVRCEMEDAQAQPAPMEPDKCAAWYWKTWDDLRAIGSASAGSGEALFLPLTHLLEQYPEVVKQRATSV